MSSAAVFELVKNAPAWQLPSTTPQQVHAELHLRVCSAPYTIRLTSYPYSTASGDRAPLPLLVSAHEVVVGYDAVELVSAVSRRCVDLDERRSVSDLASIASYTAALSQLPHLIDCYVHMHAERYFALLSEYGRGVSVVHASYLRSQRKRAVLRWAAAERLQSAEQCRVHIERLLECFSRALQSSSCEYLFSRQPSSADVLLAAYVAFIALAPHDDTVSARPASSSSAWPVSALNTPFVPLSTLLTAHPLLALHSRLLFERFFPAFSFHPPHAPPPAASPTAAASASASAVSDYLARSDASLLADVSVAAERAGGAAVLLADLHSRLAEAALPRGSYRPPIALPIRGGDQWVEQAKAALSAEERERMVQRSRRMWLLGGAALILAFVLWQRSKVSPAPRSAGSVAAATDTATASLNTS